MTIVGISGSLRKNSFNAGLLRAAAEALSSGTRLEILSIRDIPLYDGDVEEVNGYQLRFQQIKDRVASADGLLLATPEYNNSIPGVFKNAIDWMSRPVADISRVFGDRPVALMGATPAWEAQLSLNPHGFRFYERCRCAPGLADVSWFQVHVRPLTGRETLSMRRFAAS
jgi:NAD(P)H-dependent FMN reductase